MAKFVMTIDDRQLRNLIKKKIASAPKIIASVIDRTALKVLSPATRNRLRQNKSIFNTDLIKSINTRPGPSSSNRVTVDFGALDIPYARHVEMGQGPHSPDEDKIKDYVKGKLNLYGLDAIRVTRAIINTLRNSGSKPHPYLIPTFKANEKKFLRRFIEILRVELLREKI